MTLSNARRRNVLCECLSLVHNIGCNFAVESVRVSLLVGASKLKWVQCAQRIHLSHGNWSIRKSTRLMNSENRAITVFPKINPKVTISNHRPMRAGVRTAA